MTTSFFLSVNTNRAPQKQKAHNFSPPYLLDFFAEKGFKHILKTDTKIYQFLTMHNSSSLPHLETLCRVNSLPFLHAHSSSCFYYVFA